MVFDQNFWGLWLSVFITIYGCWEFLLLVCDLVLFYFISLFSFWMLLQILPLVFWNFIMLCLCVCVCLFIQNAGFSGSSFNCGSLCSPVLVNVTVLFFSLSSTLTNEILDLLHCCINLSFVSYVISLILFVLLNGRILRNQSFSHSIRYITLFAHLYPSNAHINNH